MAFCLGTLVELLDQILRPQQYHQNWVLDNDKIPQIQSLFQKASFLRDFLANSTPAIQARIETLEDLIRDAAENAEDTLQSYIKALVLSNPVGQRFMISPPDLTDVCQVFISAAEEMIKIKAASGQSERTTPTNDSSNVSSHPAPSHVLVGVKDSLTQLRDRLTSRSPMLEVISIVGMGGIGKTTLASKLYDEYSSNKHFDICLWATVSQDYDQRQVLLSLLGCRSDKRNEELKVDLHKELWSRRYLIVLDDVWSPQVWDDIRTCSPDNKNRSRIILTTRGNDVADYVSSRRHEMSLLNMEDSLELFGKIVHGSKKFPEKIQKAARKIVSNCGGLPLAVKVIAGFMSRVEQSNKLWKKVADDTSSFVAKEDEQFLTIFSWSYANLPHYLKPCLLYMGAFPEDHAIQASRLIKLWAAEGFLYPIKDKSPEEVAEIYLNALIDRNLIIVRERKFSGRVKSYGIHDILRDMCLRKAEEKKFIFAKRLGELKHASSCLRRVCVSSPNDNLSAGFMEQMSTQARSFLFIGRADERVLANSGFELSLLRILDMFTVKFVHFPEDILKLVNLKFLALYCESDCKSPLSIGVLKNLETIIFSLWGSGPNLQMGIFRLPQLRHLKFHCSWAPPSVVPRSFSLGETLQNLAYVPVAIVTHLLGKLPNLKRLGILGYDCEIEPNIDLTSFPRLETLKVSPSYYLSPMFPPTLRELTIRHATKLSWTFMSRIGGLPNLQLLRLQACQFETSTWEPADGEFCNLQYLQLSDPNLENWIADETHFPQLRHLFLDWCTSLKEIPLELGGIETLELLNLDFCKVSVIDSARSILQEQRDFGNDNLKLRLGPWQLSDNGQWEHVCA